VLEQGASSFISPAYDSTNEVVFVALKDDGNSGHGTGVVYQPTYSATNLTSENYIGMSGGFVAETTVTQSSGTPVTFEAALSYSISAAYDSANNKVVIAYRDGGNSGYGTAVVGTTNASNNSISFGTPVVFESANTTLTAITYDVNAGKMLISYNDDANSGRLTAIVGSVSGTGISFGTAVVVDSLTSVTDIASTYDANAQKVVVVATLGGSPSAFVSTISGTSVSFGSRVAYGGTNRNTNKITYDANAQKVVVIYRDGSSANQGRARVGTVSGTSISFGAEATFQNSGTDDLSIDYDANAQKVVVAYQDSANSDYGTAIVGTVSGTTISFGTKAAFSAAATGNCTVVYDSNAQAVAIFYRDANPFYGKVVSGNVSGTSITFTTATTFQSSRAESFGGTYDANAERVVLAYRDYAAVTGDAVVFTTGYTYITRGEVADGDNATVDIVGTVSRNQLNLTAGQQYYVQTDGTIGTTAADPSVLAGTAVSATKMVVKS